MDVFELLGVGKAKPVKQAKAVNLIPNLIPLPKLNRLAAVDTETFRFSASRPIPPMVCITIYDGENRYIYGGTDDDKKRGLQHFLKLLSDPDFTIVGLNGFYDWLVLTKEWAWQLGDASEIERLIYSEMRAGRIRELAVAAKLLAIRNDWLRFDPVMKQPTKASLSWLAKRYLDVTMTGKKAGDDEDDETIWRTQYEKLNGLPVATWPQEAVRYAVDDAYYTYETYMRIHKVYGHQRDEVFQTLKAWAMYKSGVWGGVTDPDRIQELVDKLTPKVEATRNILHTGGFIGPDNELLYDKSYGAGLKVTGGLFKQKPIQLNKDKLETYIREKAQAFGIHLAITPTGRLSTKKDTGIHALAGFDPVTKAYLAKNKKWLLEQGFADDPGLSKDKKAIQARVEAWYTANDEEIPRTDKMGISTDREALTGTTDKELHLLASIGSYETILNTFVPAFWRGVDNPVHPFWNPLVASGRVSVSRPNLNNVPKYGGVRECFKARDGYVLISADYTQAELCSLAQICLDKFGFSRMAEAIRAGRDLHLVVAAQILGVSYEVAEEMKSRGDADLLRARALAKVANFGFPGGQGIKSFKKFAAKAGFDLTYDEVYDLKNAWIAAYPEVKQYFAWINQQIKLGGGSKFDFHQIRSGRIRGGVGYCDGCNTGFQGLTADGAGNAYIMIDEGCYYDKESPLYGSRVFAFIYDEFIIEAPKEKASDAAFELARLMRVGMEEFTPDVPASVEPEMMLNWTKESKQAFDGDVLIPWEMLDAA